MRAGRRIVGIDGQDFTLRIDADFLDEPVARIIRPAGSVPSPAAAGDDEDKDDRYRPPPPAPLPTLDSMGKAAWAGLLGGPGYLLAATLRGWQVSDWSALLAIVAFVAGFAILVLRLGDKPRDDDDNGAVV